MLNRLHQSQRYKGFKMEPRGPQINHLSFADDVIIFTSRNKESMQLIMKILGDYESTSDQLINKEKSHFLVLSNAPNNIINTIQEVTGFSQKDSPISYLGCPLYIGRFLSFGGKITLVKHVLQSIPIHTMAAVSPPNTTIKYIESVIADFFWVRDDDKRKYHWASLETMSLPCEEGGVELRRLTDICTALQFKQWWVFRSKSSLWGNFLKAKYCQRANPVAKKLHTGQSLVWGYMMKYKHKVEEQIRENSNRSLMKQRKQSNECEQ
ncbi:hypothetical protein KY284_032408 [Solanum tuberosum]|nr:hypothetical protein KY284_032408 [Solanum tuberosum]